MTCPTRRASGQRCHAAKLTEEQAREIFARWHDIYERWKAARAEERRLSPKNTMRMLAEDYGVSESTIEKMVYGDSWWRQRQGVFRGVDTPAQ